MEWWLGYEAWRVIHCSRFMGGELRQIFQLPQDKLRMIPNGVFPGDFAAEPPPPGFREQYAAPDEKILFHVGRLVREKGLDVLLEAMPHILARFPQAKLVIAGRGGHEEELKEHAQRLGIYHRIYFAGYIDDKTRNWLYRLADAAVFPSLYEPFGIVALEAMAAGTPPVVSDTGGLSEVVEHGRNGLKARTGNPLSLAENILWMLLYPHRAARLRHQAYEDVQKLYGWDDIAVETQRVYHEVLAEQGTIPAGETQLLPQALVRDESPVLTRYG